MALQLAFVLVAIIIGARLGGIGLGVICLLYTSPSPRD